MEEDNMKEKKESVPKLLFNIIVPLVILALVILFVPKLIGIFMPFVIGFLVSLIANPLVRFLAKKLKIRRKAGSVIVIVLVLAAVFFILWGVITGLISVGGKAASKMPEFTKTAKEEYEVIKVKLDDFSKKLPKNVEIDLDSIVVSVKESVENWFSKIGTSGIVKKIGEVTSNIPGILIGLIVGIMASYFFVADRDELLAMCRKHMSDEFRKQLRYIKTQCFDVIGGYFKAQFKIMAVVYVILLIGLWILGTPFFPLTAFGIAFVDMLPFFGTGTILGPWAIIRFLMGDYKMTIFLAVLYAITQVVRQLIQPKLLGDSIGMNPFATLFFMYVGFISFGVIGMILAVPIAMIVINLIKNGVFDSFIYSVKELYTRLKNYLHIEQKS